MQQSCTLLVSGAELRDENRADCSLKLEMDRRYVHRTPYTLYRKTNTAQNGHAHKIAGTEMSITIMESGNPSFQ